MTQKINLQPATLADAGALAQLWVATFPDKFGPVLGVNAEPVLCDWLRLSQRHLQTTTVAKVDEVIVGFIVLETPSAPRPDDGRWLWHALQLHYGTFGALRGLLLTLLIDSGHQPNPQEVYIEMLGVNPAWRGRGVAHRLLAHAETVAHTEKLNGLSLTVVSDNDAAITLYQKTGFTIRSEYPNRVLAWITGHRGYYEMVKQFKHRSSKI